MSLNFDSSNATFSTLIALSLIAGSMASPTRAQTDGSPTEAAEQATNQASETGGLFGSTNRQSLLPEGLTADQFIQFFTLFSANDDITPIVDPMFAQMLEPGPQVDGWQSTGINIVEEFEALDGGLRDNLIFEGGELMTSVVDLSGEATPDLSHFLSYALRPEIPFETGERAFLKFTQDVWFETFGQRENRDNALCYSGYVGITLHSKTPYTEWSEDELLTNAMIFAVADRLANLELCVVYDRKDDDTYSYKAYLPDGRTLPALNNGSDVSLRISFDKLQEALKGSESP